MPSLVKGHLKILHTAKVDMGSDSLVRMYSPALGWGGGGGSVSKGPLSGIKLRVYQRLQAALFIDHGAPPL